MSSVRPLTGTAKRSPFVLLVVVLLAGGLISLLLLNAAVNQDSFELTKLQKETTQLTDEKQALQQDVGEYAAPGALDKRARELGMVPGGNPAFLAPDGTVRGVPGSASALPSPTSGPSTSAPSTVAASPQASLTTLQATP